MMKYWTASWCYNGIKFWKFWGQGRCNSHVKTMWIVMTRWYTVVDCILQRWLSSVSLIPHGLLTVSSWCSSHWVVRSMSLPREQGQTFVIVSTHRVPWKWCYVTSKSGWYKSSWRKNVLREVDISSWVIGKWKAENVLYISPALSKENRQEIWQIHFLLTGEVEPVLKQGRLVGPHHGSVKPSVKHFTSLSVSVSAEKHVSCQLNNPRLCHWRRTDLGRRIS